MFKWRGLGFPQRQIKAVIVSNSGCAYSAGGSLIFFEVSPEIAESAWKWRKQLPFYANIRCSNLWKIRFHEDQGSEHWGSIQGKAGWGFQCISTASFSPEVPRKSCVFTLATAKPWSHWQGSEYKLYSQDKRPGSYQQIDTCLVSFHIQFSIYGCCDENIQNLSQEVQQTKFQVRKWHMPLIPSTREADLCEFLARISPPPPSPSQSTVRKVYTLCQN